MLTLYANYFCAKLQGKREKNNFFPWVIKIGLYQGATVVKRYVNRLNNRVPQGPKGKICQGYEVFLKTISR